eukprot:g26664.t1
MLLAKPFLQLAFGSYASCNQSAVPLGSTCISPHAPTNADNVTSVPVPSLPAPNIYIPDPDVTDPLARFKRNRKSESSNLSSSSSLPATSSGSSSSSSSAACSSSSSYSIGGLNYLPPNVSNFFNTILPTLRNEPLLQRQRLEALLRQGSLHQQRKLHYLSISGTMHPLRDGLPPVRQQGLTLILKDRGEYLGR